MTEGTQKLFKQMQLVHIIHWQSKRERDDTNLCGAK